MKHSRIILFIMLIIIMVLNTEVIVADIYRLINPINGSSKSPNDGPPFLRFGNTQYYYHTETNHYNNHLSAVNSSFTSWNNAGTVQFSSSQSSGLTLTVFTEDYGENIPPYIVNPGKTYLNHDNCIINPNTTSILLNTHHIWGIVQDLQAQQFDVQTILVHEIGHVHGLSHPDPQSYTHDASAPLMAGADNEYFWNNTARDLRTDDINGTRFLQYNTWVPQQCTTIQAALTNSFSGCTVYINNGTYTENLTVGNKNNLTITGQSSANTIINGSLTAYYCNNFIINSLNCNNITAYYCNSSDYNCNSNNGGIALYSCSGFDQSGTISNSSIGLIASYSSGNVLSGSNYSSNGTSIVSSSTGNVAVNFTRLCTSVNYDFEASYYGYISAYASYFGNGNPRISQHDGGVVSITYPMSCGLGKMSDSPGGQDELQTSKIEIDNPLEQEFSFINSKYFNLLQKLKKTNGMVIEDNGELQHQFLNTVNDFKGFIKKYPNSSLSRVALTSVANSYWLISQRDGVMNYNSNRMHFLEEIINDRELNSLKGASEVLKVDNYVSQKDFTGAIIQAEDVISKYTNDKELQCAAMLKKGLILSYELNQKEKAAECFRAILKDYQDNPIKEFAENQLKVLGIEEKENSVGILLSKVKDFAAEAYPNPFNPSTTIRYNIPQNGKIVIKVYDLLGREIAELVNEIKQAGSYNVLWNGKNSFGSEVSSGIYFYKIQLNDQAITKKMMLVR